MEILKYTSGDIAPAIVSKLGDHKAVTLELEDLYMILQIEPNDSIIALELARRLNGRGRQAEALRILRNVVDIDFRFATLNALGQTEYELDLGDDAFNHLQTALLVADDKEPALFDVFKTLGNLFVKRGDFMSAEDSYNKAHRLNPHSDALLVNFGTLAIQRADWDQALTRFKDALVIDSSNDKAWTGLAIGHRMKGDQELAMANLEAALQYNCLNETALTLILDWGVADGREAYVLEHLRSYLVAGGWNEKFSLAFATLSLRRGEHFLATLELERLLAVNPSNEGALRLVSEARAA